ncbi:MAG: amino acid adenylation domain-containing protein [Bacillota bacterium]|nr:amino acid adenylation domain-containing protein [Bacillota bacterium]
MDVYYNSSKYSETLIRQILQTYHVLVKQAIFNPDMKLSEFEITSERERDMIINKYSGTVSEYQRDKKLSQLFEERVKENPDKVAVRFYDKELTYGQINDKANSYAHLLREKGVGAESIVAVMMERSLDMIVALLAINKAGAAYMPIEPDFPKDRISYMLNDSNSKLMLTQSSLKGVVDTTIEQIFMDLTDVSAYSTKNMDPVGDGSSRLYIIYTSGTTGKPKGVMFVNRAMTNLVEFQNKFTSIKLDDKVLQFATITFDVGSQEIWSTLLSGGTLELIDFEKRKDVSYLLNFINERKIPTVFLPTAYFKLIASEDDYLRKLVKFVEHVIVAGEQLVIENHVPSYLAKNNTILHNHYGPTESHVVTTYTLDADSSGLPPIGKPICNSQVYILDKEGKIVPSGMLGEIYLAGDCLADGYINNQELTAEKFVNNPFCKGQKMYKTGDLGKWLEDGNIEYLGRIDDQVKIRGFRVEVGEVQNAVLKIDMIKDAIVTVKKQEGEKYLACYYVAEKCLVEDIKSELAKYLPDYMIPSYFISLDKIPYTKNGKVDRRALPEPIINKELEYMAPSNELETKLQNIWMSILNLPKIGVNDDFFEIGGHSLKAARMVGRIHKELGLNISVKDLFDNYTIKKLADYLSLQTHMVEEEIPKLQDEDFYVVSAAQKRIYILQNFNPKNTSYNISGVVEIKGVLDEERLRNTFMDLISCQEALRTTFDVINNEIVQKITPMSQVDINIEKIKLSDISDLENIMKGFVRPFDFKKDLLLRVGIARIEAEKFLLFLDTHHIITDGVSLGILIREFANIYSGLMAEQIDIQYKDYADWQYRRQSSEIVERQKRYWLETFKDDIPVLTLPLDYPRADKQDMKGDLVRFVLDKYKTEKLNNLAREQNSTLYMVLLSCFYILLSRYSGQNTITVGTAVAGRTRKEVENIIGMFVNTLALKNQIKEELTFNEFLKEIKTNVLLALENQEYPFEEMVKELNVERQFNRNPVFDVMFVLQNMDNIEHNIGEITIKEIEWAPPVEKMDLTVNVREVEGQLEFIFSFAVLLFDKTTIEAMTQHYQNIIDIILENTLIRLNDIDILNEEDKVELLVELNDHWSQYPSEASVIELFEEQVQKSPKQTAVTDSKGSMNYEELNWQANLLANKLLDKGIEKEQVVGIMTERTCQMIVGILGILKAGAAYLPIDPSFPLENKRHMIEDGNVSIVLVEDSTADILLPKVSILNLSQLAIKTEKDLPLRSNADSLCYIMYTSGSTGNPKGVGVIHRNIVRLVKNTNYITFKDGDRILQTGAPSFDATTFEVWGALLNGIELFMVEKDNLLLAYSLEKELIDKKITILWLTSPLFNQLAEQKASIFRNLSYLLVGGDRLSPMHIAKVMKECPRVQIVNGYGPTENTTFSVCYQIPKIYDHDIPIGIPISNSTAYVLDHKQRLVPKGVYGELYLGGDGLSRGYIFDPKLTAEKFIHNPYCKGEIMYKTGDLVRWNKDGILEFAGRIDSQVKIRGYRIELRAVENQIRGLKEIEDCVITVRQKEQGEKVLCAYFTAKTSLNVNLLRQKIEERLPNYMVPTYFIQMDKFPLNKNGKISIKELPEPKKEFVSNAKYEAAESELEGILHNIFSDVLGISRISMTDNFFDIGGHSLNATIISYRIFEALGKEIKIRDIFKFQTIRRIAEFLNTEEAISYERIPRVDKANQYETSPAQKRLYLIQQFDPESCAYNIPYYFVFSGRLDPNRMEKALYSMLERHEILRTIYETKSNEIVQKVLPIEEIKFSLQLHEINEEDIEKKFNDFIRPFNLNTEIPIRICLAKVNDYRWILMIDIHHIASDGASLNMFITELGDLYNDKELETTTLQYKDYASWAEIRRHKPIMKQQELYWLNELEGDLPLLELPTDYKRPKVRDFKGNHEVLELDRELTSKLKEYAKKTGSSMYMILLSAVNVLLSKYSGQEDIIIGSPINGRNHPEIEKLQGMFVNTIVIRSNIGSGMKFSEIVENVKEKTLQAYDNQEYPFESLVEKLNIPRRTDRNAIFDVMFLLQNNKEGEFKAEGLNIEKYSSTYSIEKFDMTIECYESEENIQISFGYATSLFKAETIQRMTLHYQKILNTILENTDICVKDIELITEDEKTLINENYNNSDCMLQMKKSLKVLIEDQVQKTPDLIAVVANGEELSYQQLNERANHLAEILQKRGIGRHSHVGIKIQRSVDLIIGIVAILKVGAAYVPIEVDYPIERIKNIVKAGELKLILTDEELLEKLVDIEVVIINEGFMRGKCHKNPDTINEPEDIAYIIFTSGSTGVPKGVIITHQACINTILDINQRFQVSETDSILMVSSIGFDLSVYDVFGALSSGAKVVISSDSKNMDELSYLLDTHCITLWNSVPAFMDMLCNSLERGYQNYHLKNVLLSGDWIPLSLPDKIRKAFPMADITSLGGATEGSIWSIYYPIDKVNKEWTSIPYGYPLANQKMYVLDEGFNQQPIGVPGEICIGGVGVAKGYINDPEKTNYSFIDHHKFGRIYRTGDKGVFTSHGYIEFLGRLDFQVKLRGHRIELEEIQLNLLQYSNITDAIVVMKERQDGQFLCAYYVADDEYDVHELREHLLKFLPAYMIPSYFVKLEKIPLTANGKVNRKALPEPKGDIHTGIDYIEPANDIEESLLHMWKEVLSISRIGTENNFFELGGHSLNATFMLGRVAKELGFKISLKDLFTNPTVKGLANLIQSRGLVNNIEFRKADIQYEYEVSSQQRRIFIECQANPDTTAYNMPLLFEIQGLLDEEKLKNVFIDMMKRHEALRTSFYICKEQIVQRIHQTKEFDLENITVFDNNIEKAAREIVKPFDLTKAPLMRAAILNMEEKKYLFIDMHHIVSDGVSMGLFSEEFIQIYDGKELEPAIYQYKDYSEWSIRNDTKVVQSQKEYWIKEFEGDIPALNLPADFQRPAIKDYYGAEVTIFLDEVLTKKLMELSRDTNTTLYMVLLSAFTLMLSKLSGQKDLVVGSPIAGRTIPQLEKIFGVFINSIAIHAQIDYNLTYREYLEYTRGKILGAYDNQTYQFDKLINDLNISTNQSRSPLFDVMFIMQNMHIEDMGSSSLKLSSVKLQQETEKYDLTLTATQENKGIALCFSYASSLFKKETIQQYSTYMKNILYKIVEDTDQVLSSINLMDAKSIHAILHQYNDTYLDYPREKTIMDCIEDTMNQYPCREALVFNDLSISYGELKDEVNKISELLIEAGVKEEDLVAVKMNRSLKMIAAILGVLNVGAAYLPIDPTYPNDRISYILDDSCSKYLILDGEASGEIKIKVRLVNEDEEKPQIEAAKRLAYVIYTSGSTGRPKGVRIENRNVVNFAYAMKNAIDMDRYHTILCITTMSFDIFVLETLVPLMFGMKIVLTSANEDIDGNRIAELIHNNKIEIVQSTPSRWGILLGDPKFEEAAKTLKMALIGGEPLTSHMAEKLKSIQGLRLMNMYGPTETTVWSMVEEIIDPSNITIGRAIANTQIYILDEFLIPVPPKVTGELYIGGEGVGRDYFNRDDLTKERFIDNPFVKGDRIYKTGDCVRWTKDGKVEFIGRADNQVKLRGYRIELGEIEEVLLKLNGVKKAKVLLKNKEDNQYLCAFLEWSSEEMSQSEIRSSLHNYLPEYMIPSIFITMEKIPMMDNGKVDVQKLTSINVEFKRKIDPPQNPTEEFLLKELSNILGIDQLGVRDNIFEFGANSLNVMRFIQRIRSVYELSYSQVIKNPYITEMAKVVTKSKEDSLAVLRNIRSNLDKESKNVIKEAPQDIKIQKEAYQRKIKEVIRRSDLNQREDIKDVLLCGGTGYLGAHILRELLENTEYKLHLLIRGKSVEEASKKVSERIKFYFDKSLIDYRDRVEIYNCDITKEWLGLDKKLYKKLASQCECVINAAADVRHFGEYEQFYISNVLSVKNLAEFCRQSKKKLLTHISTTSIGSGEIEKRSVQLFTEYDMSLGQIVENNYVRSKLEAEEYLNKLREEGMDITIIRVGNLVFQSETGRFQINIEGNAFYQRIRALIGLGKIPASDSKELEFSFVDETAKAIRILFDRSISKNKNYHVFNPNNISYIDLYNLLDENGYDIDLVDYRQFLDEIISDYDRQEVNELVDMLLIHSNFTRSESQTDFILSSALTDSILKELDFQWKAVSAKQIYNMVEYGIMKSFFTIEGRR